MIVKVKIDARNLTAGRLTERLGLNPMGPVQKEIDSSVIRFSMPYVPKNRGILEKSAWNATRIGSGTVVYPGPYAHYQYMGEIYGPNFPVEFNSMGVPIDWRSPKGVKKKPTGRLIKYKKDHNLKAGSHWIDRMKADRMDDIIKEAVKKIGN